MASGNLKSYPPTGRTWAEGEEVTNMDNGLGWLTPFKTNISDVEYLATEQGRAASAANNR
jgi:hypothetical protein